MNKYLRGSSDHFYLWFNMDECVRHRRDTNTHLQVSVMLLLLAQYVQGGGNLALLKPTSASFTQSPTTGPEHAVDGVVITEMDFSAVRFCSYVGDSGASWWQVDLQTTVWVSHVIITPASYTYGRPTDFQLLVLPDPRCSSAPQICLEYTGTLPGITSTLSCSQPLRGRIVRLSQTGSFYLCEFEVYDVSSSSRSTYFIQSAGERRDLTSPLELEVESAVDCGRSCVQEGWSYFNCKQHEGLCQLPSVSNLSDVITSDTDWYYYEEDPCRF